MRRAQYVRTVGLRSRAILLLSAVVGCTAPGSSPDGDGTGTTTSTPNTTTAQTQSDAGTADGLDDTTGAEPPEGETTQSGSDTGRDVPELPAPQNVATVPANGQVGIEWDLVEGATRYDVYWSTRPGVDSATAEQLSDVTPGFIHEERANGTTYSYVVVASNEAQTSAPSIEVSATPGGTFRLEMLGTGRMDGILEDRPLSLPIERRVHVVLLPEGYLEADLDVFELDIDEWREETMTIDPYARFAPAFVLWKLPLASNEHIGDGDPQPADTAFAVPLADGGVADVPSDGPTATRIWDVLGGFAYPPTEFYPAGGTTTLQAKTLLAHVLVYHPEQGNSGFSGRARRMDNPADPDQKLSVAFAHSRAHEFSHAFARLQDEYMSDSQLGEANAMAAASAWISNVVVEPDCDTLPWAHLVFGGEHNASVDELVGAFGRPETGYHAELRCLMNGDHGNAEVFGGDGELRIPRLCNFCGELATLRLFERIGVLDDPAASLDTWTRIYRAPYYDRFGLVLPDTIPQENSDGEPLFFACTP
jgi:hypothetical protein